MTALTTQLDKALAYAEQGIRVFPCSSRTKAPAVRGGKGFDDATTDKATIRRWWGKYPNALIGSPNSQFVVVDVDFKDLCAAGKVLTESAVSALREAITDGALEVKTKNNGIHFYFNACDNVKRMIHVLPSIDLLGDGGYVILPDQKTYKAITSNSPWESMASLPTFKHAQFTKLVEKMSDVTKTAAELKKAHKKANPKKKVNIRTKRDYSDQVRDLTSIPKSKKGEGVLSQEELNNPPANAINYDTGVIEFEQTPDMYTRNKDAKITSDFLVEFDDRGYLMLGEHKLNSEIINTLFHNRDIQERLAQMMGLDVPRLSETGTLNRSIFPNHIDNKPSLGLRWSVDKTHLIARDFANHFGDRYGQTDFNLVRLYASAQYNALVPRMKAPEFVVWFCRMMHEAGILDISGTMKTFHQQLKFKRRRITSAETKVADGLLLLDAIKSLYDGYDGTTTYADKFCSAWAGVCPSTGNRVKHELIAEGFAKVEGVYDCSGGMRADGFYETRLLSIITEETLENETPNTTAVDDFKAMVANNINNAQKREENPVSEEQPRLVTMVKLVISDESYAQVKNFAEDYDMGEVPNQDNMFILVGGTFGTVDINKPNDHGVYRLELESIDPVEPLVVGGNPHEVVYAIGDSDEIRLLSRDIMSDERFNEPLLMEPLMGPVISSFYTGNHDRGMMLTKLREYTDGELTFDTFKVLHTTSDMVRHVYDGEDVA